MKDIIIGVSKALGWQDLQYWITSINLSGFAGERVLILMDCDAGTMEKVNQAGFLAVGPVQNHDGIHDSSLPVHVERFIHIAEYLRRRGPFRWAITTDVRDVIFQQDPVVFLERHCQQHDLVFSSEGLRYQHEPWGNDNLLRTFGTYAHSIMRNNEIFNVGVLAGRSEAMQALCMNIFYHALHRPVAICDQAVFNFLISQPPYPKTSLYARSAQAWACQLGTTADPTKMGQFRQYLIDQPAQIRQEVVVNHQDQPFCMVHQYDRVPAWRTTLQKKYTAVC